MGTDILGSAMTFLTILSVLVAAFLLAYGLWEAFFKKVFSDAQEMEERSVLKAVRKVLLRRMAGINRKFIWLKYERRVNRNITSAGGLDGLTAEEFMALQELACVAFTIFGYILMSFMISSMKVKMSMIWLSLFTIFGLFFPMIWLRDQVKKRHKKITRELPYNLDLLTLSVEAGLDFQAAVATVVQKGKKGPLVEELDLMLKHLRMGKTRQEALHMMAERVNLYALSQFVNSLIQADRMGTSLGKVLRIQSTQLRIERTQRAEKLAGEAPVKMLGPLIFCIFPTVFMVLFSPIIFQFVWGNPY